MNGTVQTTPLPNGTANWNPPQWAKLVSWAVKDLGLPTALTVVLIGVIIGWIDSPLKSIPPLVTIVESHEREEAKFRDTLIATMREQKCMSGLPAEVKPQAALARDACEYLTDWIQRRDAELPPAPRPRPRPQSQTESPGFIERQSPGGARCTNCVP